jgi:hypothetical protein
MGVMHALSNSLYSLEPFILFLFVLCYPYFEGRVSPLRPENNSHILLFGSLYKLVAKVQPSSGGAKKIIEPGQNLSFVLS